MPFPLRNLNCNKAVGAGFTTALIGARRTLLGVGLRDLAARALSRAGLEVRSIA